jgi:hypothetical protein
MNTKNLPNLDACVLSAVNFFSKNKPPRLNLKKLSFPLVVGSGNAYNTGQVLFGGQPAIIASESNFTAILKSYRPLIKNKTIKQCLVISASGEKDSVWEIKAAKKAGLPVTLITCSPQSTAAKLADQVIAYRKLPEPYTYNTSTYLGIILGASGEAVPAIKTFIGRLKFPKNFKNYHAYSFILPDKFGAITPMLEIKRNELFGPYLSLRAFSYGEARHAKFVNTWDKELVISLGKNKYFGSKDCRWEINLPSSAGNGLVMALTYYIVGHIQSTKLPYFKKNIAQFCQEGPRAYGSDRPFPVIVE